MSKDNGKRKLCVSSLVLGIIGIVTALFVPAAAYACAVPGLVNGIKKSRRNYNSSAGIVLNIIALSLALINSVIGVLMTIKIFFSDDKRSEKD